MTIINVSTYSLTHLHVGHYDTKTMIKLTIVLELKMFVLLLLIKNTKMYL